MIPSASLPTSLYEQSTGVKDDKSKRPANLRSHLLDPIMSLGMVLTEFLALLG
jgi:hypothetical protein